MLLIRGGRVVDPVTGADQVKDVLIDGTKILAVGDEAAQKLRNPQNPDSLSVIDAAGLIVAPGFVDGHVHFRDPGYTYKEDIFTGAAAAARGGYTTVICMANTKPPVDNPSTLSYVLERGKQTGIHVLSAANLTKGMRGRELTDMEALKDAGAVVFTDDGVPVMDEHLLMEGMAKARKLGVPVSLHEEDPELMSQPGVNAGRIAKEIGYGGAEGVAEYELVARDCALALRTGASVCIQHVSSGHSVEFLRFAKMQGANVHAEVTPHHFTLTEEDVLKYGTNARMNPPLRTEWDRRMLIEGLMDGTIDMIATDHAPHSAEEKACPMDRAPSGIIGLETSLGLGILSLVQPGYISLMQLMELMSTSPGEMYGLAPEGIKAGAPADIVIFGENENWKVEGFCSKASNSPFLGWELPGRIHYTICAGNIVYHYEKIQ